MTNFNFAESSPLLSFGKAALLGYTSKSNPRNCYQEYPKCPRNPDRLIHYLNNHNGGFFRFFNKLNHGNNPYTRPYIVQSKYCGFVLNDFIIIKYYEKYLNTSRCNRFFFFLDKQNQPSSLGFGFKIDSDQTGTSELKFDSVSENDTRYYEPRIRNQLNRVVFPDDERSTIFVDTSNRLPKTLFDSDYSDTDDDGQHDSSNFFPQVIKMKKKKERKKLSDINTNKCRSTKSLKGSYVFSKRKKKSTKNLIYFIHRLNHTQNLRSKPSCSQTIEEENIVLPEISLRRPSLVI